MGSPPLARGTGGGTPNILHISGITPACAGNRCGQRICPQSARDHPRLRGEQTFSNIEQQSAEGSPPLARGTVAAAWPVPPCQRITPACAGNSAISNLRSYAGRDHPRLRGEQSVLTRGKTPRVGSPPLARGTVYRTSPPRARGGITPACAGNRHTEDKAYHGIGDHPRLRGEQCHSISAAAFRAGSPPLARGTVTVIKALAADKGITPACAGNRLHLIHVLIPVQDHPRLRGEQSCFFVNSPTILGSPPLARGTAVVRAVRVAAYGITPACAGNRNIPSVSPFAKWDHPRLRGEQTALQIINAFNEGSPPLARGTAS